MYAWGLSRTDRIFVQHAGQLAALTRQWRSKAHVLPKVCDIDPSRPAKSHAERMPSVAWVGTLVRFKRPDLLVHIASNLPQFRFVVCGGVPQSTDAAGADVVAQLRALPNVEYLGHVAPEKAAQIIANAALLLSTSDVEGFPNTFVQAWSCGTPVITLTIDPDQIIARLHLGAVVGTVDRAIPEIRSLLDGPQRRHEMGARARQFVYDNYKASTVVRLFERALMGGSQ
jgi:glycosyltransferase involved in cell wall biosynthesis